MNRRYSRHVHLFCFALSAAITAISAIAVIFYSWTALAGTLDQQVTAAYASMIAWSIGTFNFVAAELLRPRRR